MRYVQVPAKEVVIEILQDSTRIEAKDQKQAQAK